MKKFMTVLLASVLLLSACGARSTATEPTGTEPVAQIQLPPTEPEALPVIPEETEVATVTEPGKVEAAAEEKTDLPQKQPEAVQPAVPNTAEPKPAEPADPPSVPAAPQVDKNGLPVLPKETVYLHVGDSLELCPGYSGSKALTWKSSRKATATVSAEGIVTGVTEGTVVITVSDGKNKATCTVTVRTSFVQIQSCWMLFQVGKGRQVEYQYYGNGMLRWELSDPSVATITPDGRLTGKKWGDITLTLTDGKDSDTCEICVRVTDNVLNIYTAGPVFVGESLTMNCQYEGSDLRPLRWSSSDPTVLTVDSKGVITGQKKGKATVYCNDGDMYASCDMEVKDQSEKTTGLYFHHKVHFYDGVTRFAGDSMRLMVGAKPLRSSSITLTTSDPTVISVKIDTDPQYASINYTNYKVEFKKAGTAKLTMTSSDGCIKETYTVHVRSTYNCDPGKSSLTPEEFAYCATQVGSENGQEISSVLSGYRYHYVKEEELTWKNAKKVGESLAKEWCTISIDYILVTYAGWDEDRQMHLFYIGY